MWLIGVSALNWFSEAMPVEPMVHTTACLLRLADCAIVAVLYFSPTYVHVVRLEPGLLSRELTHMTDELLRPTLSGM